MFKSFENVSEPGPKDGLIWAEGLKTRTLMSCYLLVLVENGFKNLHFGLIDEHIWYSL